MQKKSHVSDSASTIADKKNFFENYISSKSCDSRFGMSLVNFLPNKFHNTAVVRARHRKAKEQRSSTKTNFQRLDDTIYENRLKTRSSFSIILPGCRQFPPPL